MQEKYSCPNKFKLIIRNKSSLLCIGLTILFVCNLSIINASAQQSLLEKKDKHARSIQKLHKQFMHSVMNNSFTPLMENNEVTGIVVCQSHCHTMGYLPQRHFIIRSINGEDITGKFYMEQLPILLGTFNNVEVVVEYHGQFNLFQIDSGKIK